MKQVERQGERDGEVDGSFGLVNQELGAMRGNFPKCPNPNNYRPGLRGPMLCNHVINVAEWTMF